MKKTTDLLKFGSRYLTKRRIINPLVESEVMLSHILNCSRAELYLNNSVLEQESWQRYKYLLASRVKRFPLQYLLGKTEFMGLEFKSSVEVFIPRPETEILVQVAIDQLNMRPTEEAKILDLGTGCGNIAVSLAKHLKRGRIFACDISAAAIKLAQKNSFLNNVNIFLVRGNLLSVFKEQKYFSLIISNPPYISSGQIPKLPQELQYEPRKAYDAGCDGLLYYRKIIKEAPIFLQDKGRLILEMGDDQRCSVQRLITQSGKFSVISVVKDYNDVQRVIVAQKIEGNG